jgi:Cell division control protein 14, SIN component
MELLLSHSFDYLSSSSPQKIRKGLRQVEGLLAQICLSRSSPANKRQSMMPLGQQLSPSSKKLGDLKDDPAFREFFKLQQSFQCNVAMRLISCLERLMGKGSNGQNDLLIISTLDLLQGVLLLHPPSRELFAREIHMNVRAILAYCGGLILTRS